MEYYKISNRFFSLPLVEQALRCAAASGNIVHVDVLCQHVVNVDDQDDKLYRRSALHWAVKKTDMLK